MKATGYSLGARFTPTWMDWPMFFHGNDVALEENMVFFLHLILADSETDTAMTLGRTSIVTADGPQSVSTVPLDLLRAA